MISNELQQLMKLTRPVISVASVKADIYIGDAYVGCEDIEPSTWYRLRDKYNKRAVELMNKKLTLDEESSVLLVDREKLDADIAALRSNPLYKACSQSDAFIAPNPNCWSPNQKVWLKNYTTFKTGVVYYVVKAIYGHTVGDNLVVQLL